MQEEVMDAEVVPDGDTPIEAPNRELEKVEPSSGSLTLFRTDDPVEVVEAAARVADALKSVLHRQGLTQNIGGNAHVRVEGWQTVGSMLGVFAVKEAVEEIPWPKEPPERLAKLKQEGKSFGFKASYRAQRADGAVVGGGEAECRRTEKTWAFRDDYALKSMAQTRATSKALKAPLGFVVALAGYQATPAEEMPSQESEGPPFGPPASSDQQAATFGKAIGYLNDTLSTKLAEPLSTDELLRVISDQFGYVPSASAGAIVLLARTIRDHSKEEA